MAIPSSLSAGAGFVEALKQVYSPARTTGKFELSTPWMKSLKKIDIGGEGQNYTWSVALGYGSGYGTSMPNIIANSSEGNPDSGATVANFVANTGTDYAVLNLDAKFMARSKNANAAFVQQLKYQVDKNLEGFGIYVARKLSGDGSGVVAQVAGTTGSQTVYTLSNPNDVKYFTVGMRIQSCTAVFADISAVRTISAIDEDAGTITCAAAATLTNSHTQIGIAGSLLAATKNIVGLDGWIPLTVAASTVVGALSSSLVNCSHARASHKERLAGHRLTGQTSKPLDELIYKLDSKMRERGARPDVVLMSFNTYNKIAAKQWSRIVPMDKDEAARLGLKPLGITTGGATLPFMADSTVPDDRVYLLRQETWKLAHLSNGVPERIGDAAGSGMFFQLDDDAVQIRYRCWAQLVCEDPFQNGVIQVDSTAF